METRSIRYLWLWGAVCLLLTATACAPSFSPLFRDYQLEEEHDQILERTRRALQEAGWSLTEPRVEGILRTEPRQVSNWGLYRVEVFLEALPVEGRHVRILFHPYRHYITGSRSKITYLKRSLRSKVLPPVTKELKDEGLKPVFRDTTDGLLPF